MRSCHPRFRFKASWNPSRSHMSIEVSLNDAYDGSNDCGLRRWGCGSACDRAAGRRLLPPSGRPWMELPTGDVGARTTSLALIGRTARISAPVRRLPYTHLIYWRGAELCADQVGRLSRKVLWLLQALSGHIFGVFVHNKSGGKRVSIVL